VQALRKSADLARQLNGERSLERLEALAALAGALARSGDAEGAVDTRRTALATALEGLERPVRGTPAMPSTRRRRF